MKILDYIATIPATGERVWYSVKGSWNNAYYSFDDQQTWNKSKLKAYQQAREQGRLRPVSDEVYARVNGAQPRRRR